MHQKLAAIDWLYILLLSAVWGSAFVFLKIASPVVGATGLVFMRVILASVLLGFLFIRKRHLKIIQKNIFPILVIGATNTALPFYLFAYAAKEINANTMAVMNGSTPLFALLFSVIWLKFKFQWPQFLGILIGLLGLAIVVGFESMQFELLPIFAAMMGAAMYGLSMSYIYQIKILDTKVMAAVTMIAATLIILPFLMIDPIQTVNWNGQVMGSIVFLGLICTGMAYIPYFLLISRVGPISTSIISLLVPLFGMIWAYLFLQEKITLMMLTGCLLIIGGVSLTSRIKE
jgi:drug/metabolite transporter (DMT)-like permease